jgi:hypothetical protein
MRHGIKSGGRQSAVGVREAHLQERFRKVAGDCRWCAHERRWSRSSEPRGLRPPALGSRCMVGEQMAIFAMHERRCTRAARVSPPWYRKTHLQRRVIFVEWLRLPLHNRLPHHGGLTPPALGAVRTSAGEKTICAMQERTFARAAGVSPPWVCTGWSVAHGVRQITCKHVSRTTGGLRPPLLVQCERLPAKKRFLRCANAHSRERRASARRGC